MRDQQREKVIQSVTWGLGGIFVLLGFGLMAMVLVGAWPTLAEPHALARLLSPTWDPMRDQWGLLPFLLGTAVVTCLALAIVVPLALATGISISRMLPWSLRPQAVRLLAALTAIPSVVFGWWGLETVVPAVRILGGQAGFSLLAAAIVLALMLWPTLGFLFAEALMKVPRSYVEASAALGASDDQTLVRILIPSAWPQLMNAFLVAVARGLGETVAVQMVIGGQVAMPAGLLSPGATLTTQLLTDATLFPPGTRGHAALDAMALALLAAMGLLVRLSARWQGQP
ncbi:MAG: ABC transporter permease subunit [Firmicutes bacterium]|nr:ABC transporter permease subunit [Bacillota bacterium]